MNLKLRRARTGDETQLYQIKKCLPLPRSNAAIETVRGGFLLGSSVEVYREFIETAQVNVLADENRIVGFAVVLPDAVLRASEIWQRKDEIEWQDSEAVELIDKPLCYFEQLAVLPSEKYRFYAVALALAAVRQAFETHAAMFATTVVKPICNRASVPLLENVGGKCVGTLDEHYPEFGDLVSAVYLLRRDVFAARIAAHRLQSKLIKQIELIGEI